jgi:bacterioferritin-associated ferredoxin
MTPEEKAKAEERAKQLARVVCICKGINLGRVLKVLEHCNTVEEVNQASGCGSGGCAGQRCGPRIKILLEKKKEAMRP